MAVLNWIVAAAVQQPSVCAHLIPDLTFKAVGDRLSGVSQPGVSPSAFSASPSFPLQHCSSETSYIQYLRTLHFVQFVPRHKPVQHLSGLVRVDVFGNDNGPFRPLIQDIDVKRWNWHLITPEAD